MRIHWKVILPTVGLLLFVGVTYHSARGYSASSRYFWWSSIPLDSTPLSKSKSACKEGVQNCQEWNPESVVPVSGSIARALILSALPAFYFGEVIAREAGLFGVSQVLTFVALMPLLIGSWFYFLGRLLDNIGGKLRARLS